MPELYKSAIGSLVRWGLQGAFGWMVAKGALTNGQADDLLLAIGLGAAALIWSLFQKYRSRLQFFTALEVPANAGSQKVEEVIAETSLKTNIAKAFQNP